jgi:acetoin:2,6-dichlorophenolindophenol oxidoreductase subunit beta
MTRELTYAQAINEALASCLAKDPSVYLMGLGVPDGVFGTTAGLRDTFGPARVRDMPISENAMTGVALGSCLVGMRPVLSHMRVEFAMAAMDQLCNQAAKWRFMFGDQSRVPLVVRMIAGRGWGNGAQHSQSLHAWFAHIPGLKVVMPASPFDAKGLLISAIEDDDPVVFIEHRWLHGLTGPVPEGHYTVPLCEPNIIRQGNDVTVVSSSYATVDALRAADVLEPQGVSCEVIDLRTISPCRGGPIIKSVQKTGRLVVADHGTRTGGFGGEILADVTEWAFPCLKAAPIRVTLPDRPVSASRAESNFYYPTYRHIIAAVGRTMGANVDFDEAFYGVTPEAKIYDVPVHDFAGPF